MKMKMNLSKRILNVLVCCLLVQFTAEAGSYTSASQSGQQSQAPAAGHTPQELQQLVAPIALYPDALVAQILAASTYPTQIVEAERWMQSHSNLKGEELAKEVDKQDWDPSVKAMTQFPSVLENMDKNLSWTSSLGEAYVSQPDDLTNAVQTLRREAQKAGHLNSNEQEKVTTQGSTIIIEPANPEVVYIPAYDPWLVYDEPIIVYPGVSRLVSRARDFLGRPRHFLWHWIWYRLLRRIWVGLASLGIRLAWPSTILRPPRMGLAQPGFWSRRVPSW
jgi:hypothetical protein